MFVPSALARLDQINVRISARTRCVREGISLANASGWCIGYSHGEIGRATGKSSMISPAEVGAVDRPKPWPSFVAAALLVGLFAPTFQQLVHVWLIDANYSHGFFILPISLWLA